MPLNRLKLVHYGLTSLKEAWPVDCVRWKHNTAQERCNVGSLRVLYRESGVVKKEEQVMKRSLIKIEVSGAWD